MTYSIGENQSCEAKGSIRQSQPLVGQDDVLEASWSNSVYPDQTALIGAV